MAKLESVISYSAGFDRSHFKICEVNLNLGRITFAVTNVDIFRFLYEALNKNAFFFFPNRTVQRVPASQSQTGITNCFDVLQIISLLAEFMCEIAEVRLRFLFFFFSPASRQQPLSLELVSHLVPSSVFWSFLFLLIEGLNCPLLFLVALLRDCSV